MPFTLGQRWISDTESELGLGTVVAMDARTVTLLFPSTGENRLYARSDSPVTRVMFNPGDTITSHEGWQLHIDEVKRRKWPACLCRHPTGYRRDQCDVARSSARQQVGFQ